MPNPTPLNRSRLAALALAAALLSACQDASRVLEPEPPALTPAPALDAGAAALLSVALDDALARLVPAAGGGSSTLRGALLTLTTSLAEADVVTLERRLQDVHTALTDHELAPADADALRLALDAVGRAGGRTH